MASKEEQFIAINPSGTGYYLIEFSGVPITQQVLNEVTADNLVKDLNSKLTPILNKEYKASLKKKILKGLERLKKSCPEHMDDGRDWNCSFCNEYLEGRNTIDEAKRLVLGLIDDDVLEEIE